MQINSGVFPPNRPSMKKVSRAGIKRVAGRIPPGLAKKPGQMSPGQMHYLGFRANQKNKRTQRSLPPSPG
jgi:hypothetical protein